MWTIALTTLHVIACIFLVIVVLLQKGKGSDVNAVFGGSSQTIFGSSGAGNFLTKLTSATAIVFMFTSLTLTIGNTKQGTKSVFDDVPAETTTPTTPEQPPTATPQAESGAPATTTTATTSTEKPAATAPAAGVTATTTPASGVTVTTTQVPATPPGATPPVATPPAAPSVTPVPAAPSAAAAPTNPKAPPASEKK
jgi:preprotein translocase subunit SecG